jgi:signal transduction histidine kinase
MDDQIALPKQNAQNAQSAQSAQLEQQLAEARADARRLSERVSDLEQAYERAERSSKAKSSFLAHLSHEIRTPMNGVLGITQLMTDTDLDEGQRSYLHTIRASCEALIAVVNDVLDSARIEAGKFTIHSEPFALAEMVQEVVALFAPQMHERGVYVAAIVPQDIPPVVRGDGVRLRQVLINLVNNACKFTPSGAITVRLERARDGSARQRVRFSVTDTGIGIPAEKLEAVFQAFEQVDTPDRRKAGGTGLGLSIASELTQLMGGTLAVESELGNGARFFFDLPLPAADEVKGSQEIVLPWPDTYRPSVMVVEDNRVSQIVATKLLQNMGCDVVVAPNGKTAVERALQSRLDVVFMDCELPDIDGWEATRVIRAAEQAESRVPIIALTASTLDEDIERCHKAGMDDHVSKPIRRSELMRALARWVRMVL